MRPITVNTFISEVENWLQWRVNVMNNNALPFLAQGGWEGWVQVELAMWFAPSDYDVIREQKIYSSLSDRVDFVLNNYCCSTSHPKVAVEIKCQSVYITSAAFRGSVNTDITKLRDNTSMEYRKLVIAFINDNNTLNHFKSNSYNIKGYGHFAFASKVVT